MLLFSNEISIFANKLFGCFLFMNYYLAISLDYFFLAFHSLLILFNLSGWILKRTRKLHLFSLLATLSSWFIVGFWMGWGYCICTDWHWQIREQLGNPIIEDSYTAFLLKELFGAIVQENVLNISLLALFFLSFALSLFYNISDKRFKNKLKKEYFDKGE